jgi:hypothetical protein
MMTDAERKKYSYSSPIHSLRSNNNFKALLFSNRSNAREETHQIDHQPAHSRIQKLVECLLCVRLCEVSENLSLCLKELALREESTGNI